MVGIHLVQLPYLVRIGIMTYGTERAVRVSGGFRLFGLAGIYGSLCRLVIVCLTR